MRRFASVLTIFILAAFTAAAPFALTGCRNLSPAAIAEGQDAVVVNAERVQRSSLGIYEQVINWEYAHRVTLPVEVSRAVDRYRREFPPAWKLSRTALADYKAKRGPDADTVAKVTAALSAAQTALLSLQSGQSDNEIVQANNAVSSLIESVKILLRKTPPPPIPVLPTPPTP